MMEYAITLFFLLSKNNRAERESGSIPVLLLNGIFCWTPEAQENMVFSDLRKLTSVDTVDYLSFVMQLSVNIAGMLFSIC